MKRSILIIVSLLVIGSASDLCAQGWLEKVGKAAVEKAKQATQQNVEQKVGNAVDKTFEKGGKAVKGKSKGNSSENMENETMENGKAVPQNRQTVAMGYAKSDFVAGDEIIFDDNLDNEKLGEFPSQWELHRGNADVASINGKKAICMYSEDSYIEPLMKKPKNYLGDVFTVEFDFWCGTKGTYDPTDFELDFMRPEDQIDEDVFTLTWIWNDMSGDYEDDETHFNYSWRNSNGNSSGQALLVVNQNAWNHIAVSFNKRAMKVYLNGTRFVNIPNLLSPPGWFTIFSGRGDAGKNKYFTNIRVAKGAVPLYDRVMSEGKFITYGITFDVGKSTIKPESLGEINRITQMMKDNPGLKFSVEGHTDSTGNISSNQTLSEERSKAIVAKLVENGIAEDRLQSVGKGQSNPIADNTTDEGRAKNRRVEFVKL
jgi:OOP family OmpA-OmpF porin